MGSFVAGVGRHGGRSVAGGRQGLLQRGGDGLRERVDGGDEAEPAGELAVGPRSVAGGAGDAFPGDPQLEGDGDGRCVPWTSECRPPDSLPSRAPPIVTPRVSPRPRGWEIRFQGLALRGGTAVRSRRWQARRAESKPQHPKARLRPTSSSAPASWGLLASLIDEARHGGGRVALIEGPAGIGKTPAARRGARPADARGMRVLTARGSELEREFSFGVVRQLFEAALADPVERETRLAGGGAGAARRARSARRRAARRGGRRSFAALHGLFWLALNIVGRAAADARHRRPALVRPPVAALRRLPRAAARGRRRSWSRRRCAPASRPPTRRCSAEIAHDPSDGLGAPGPAQRGRPCASSCARASATDADPAFCDACHTRHRRQPAAAAPAPARARGRRRAARRRARRRRASTSARAPSRAPCCCASRACPTPAIAVARAVAVLGESADLPRRRRAGGARRAADVAEATGALARAEILRPEHAARLRAPARARRGLPRAAGRRARALARARGAGAARRAARRAEQVAAQLLHDAAPRRGLGRGDAAARPAASPSARARPRAPSRTCSARSRSRRSGGAPARGRCSSSASPRRSPTAAPRAEHLLEAYEALDRPAPRARSRPTCSRARCSSRARRPRPARSSAARCDELPRGAARRARGARRPSR